MLLGIKKPKDKGKGSFKTWLYTIGRNVAVDYLRRNSKRTEISTEDCPGLVCEEQNIEIAYIKEERKITLHRALGKLKSEYRQILWLVYFEDFSIKQEKDQLPHPPHIQRTAVTCRAGYKDRHPKRIL